MNIPYLLFKKVTNNFSDDRVIGRGGFGNVYKGYLDNGELIAVKILHPLQGLDDGLFKNEVCNNLFHPNIVGLLGYCDEIHSEFVEHKGEKVSSKHVYRGLCFVYFPNGSLHKHLDEQSLAPNWSTRYNIIKGICQGLNFLHGCKPPIFHLDLKPDNILMDNSMVPKLADFGLSRLFRESHSQVTQQRIGTDKYMPQEYRNGGKISEKYDVFSLGVIMIEIMEGYSLFQEMDDVTQIKQEVLVKWSSMIEPTAKYRPQLLLQVKTCIDMAMRCVDSERKNRPTIATILATLDETETQLPSKQLAVQDLSLTSNLRNSLAETLRMMKSELDSIKISATNMEQVPEIREAPSNVEEPFIIEDVEDRETSSYVEEGLIIGRTEDRKKILSILSESSTKETVILPIYGIGGIGKTTLAQLVFSDTQFSGYSQVWVYVSEQLDLYKIGNSIISQLSKGDSNIANMQVIHNRLRELFADKRILIVLDDLWEDKPRELDKLKAMLRLGKGRRVIIVTTRDEAIARKMCSTIENVPYKLQILTDDMCWVIIKQKSDFENQPGQKQLEHIGRDIAIKCGGVALAAQSIGYMLRDMTSDQWESVRDSDIWNLSTSEDPSLTTHEVLASLRLSYSHMHKFLQICFSYCAVFPKGHIIAKYDLIYQWIALGFPQPSVIFDSMQLCEQYVTQLLGMSFLQYSNTPLGEPDAKYFTMHDLVHDLARAMLADKVNKNGSVVGSSCQYALLRDPSMPLQSSVNCPENLMALHFLDCRTIKFSEGAVSPAKCLHVLDLRGCGILELPDSIGQLKQLRYLDAQCSMIPDCIIKLSKLNYLSLGYSEIEALPDSIGDIRGLMHLDLYQCRSIRELPVSFAELKQLVHLNLSLCDLEQDNVLPEVIRKLPKLRYLMISGCNRSDIQNLLVTVSTLHNLEHLDLSHIYKLVHIPECLGHLTKLQTLDLSDCYNIRELPSWMNKMVSLKIVDITHYVLQMSKLECSRNLVLFEAIYPFVLEISELENVMSLEEAQSIELLVKQSVRYLTLEWTLDCDTKYVDDKDVLEKLVGRNNIDTLHVTGYRSLSFPTKWQMHIEQYLPNVCEITLENLPKCSNLPALGQLPNLRYLHLHRMDSLEELNTADSCGELIFPVLWLLDISSCPKLRMKPCLPRTVRELFIEASDNMLISLAESVSQTSASSFSLLSELKVGKCMVPLHQWEFLQHVSALRKLIIRDCSDIASFSSPEVIQRLSSLESLDLRDGVLAELPTWLGQLTSLQQLTLILPKLEKLNDNMRQLTRLQSLDLRECRSMTSLPQWLGELTALSGLHIAGSGCTDIRYLPAGSIRQLTELSYLTFKEYEMDIREIRELRSSIPADTDEINIGEYIDSVCFLEEDSNNNATREVAHGDPDLSADAVNTSTHDSLDHRPRAVVRHTWTRRPKLDATISVGPVLVEASQLEPADSAATANSLDTSSGSRINNSGTRADAAAVGDAKAVALVPYISALSIESGSITKNLSVPRFDAGSHSTRKMVQKSRAGVRHNQTHRHRQLVPGASSSGLGIDNSAAHAMIRADEVEGKAFVSSFSAISIDSATKRQSDSSADAINTWTHDNMLHKHDVRVRHTSTHEIPQLLPATSATTTNSPDNSSRSMLNKGVLNALIPTDEVDVKDLVSSFSTIFIDSGFTSATKNLSDPPTNVIKTSTHDNLAHNHRGGVRHTWNRQPRQLVAADSAATTNSLDTPSGSRVNSNGTSADALMIPTYVDGDNADTSVEDIIRSFFALSNEPDSATWLDM